MAKIQDLSLMREVIEKMDYMVRVVDDNHKVIYVNDRMYAELGEHAREMWSSLLGHTSHAAQRSRCIDDGDRQTGEPVARDIPIGDRIYNLISSQVSADDGRNYSVELLRDITEQKKTENTLMRHYRAMKADIKFAKHIQERALPIDGVYWNTIEVNSSYIPSEDLGGDLFDVIKINEAESLIHISDVSGHGITASLFTIFLRQMVRGKARQDADLNQILDMVFKSYMDLGLSKERYLSILFCQYNREKMEMTFLNAGHNCLPVLIKNTGEVREIEIKGMPVCNLPIFEKHETITLPVETGDRIIFYTDGITEACGADGEMFETERVLNIIKSNLELDGKALTRKVIDEVRAFNIGPVDDDLAMIVIKLI